MKRLWILAIFSSLSTAGSAMSLLALTAIAYQQDSSGIFASALQTLVFLGVGAMGLFGGYLLSRYDAVKIGIYGPIFAILILSTIAFTDHPRIEKIYLAMFLLSCISGIDNPNNLRFLNWNLESKEKPHFFSLFQMLSQGLSIASPLLASIIIGTLGVKSCIYIDMGTYLLSILPWFFVKSLTTKNRIATQKENIIFDGYKILLRNKNLYTITASRILNNISFVSYNVAIPLFIAKFLQNKSVLFPTIQGSINALINLGFVVTGIFMSRPLKNYPRLIPLLSVLASILGFSAFVIGNYSYGQYSLLFSAFLIGIGTYCFRISGMSLGSALTPPDAIGQVIVAGDTIVRSFSFGIGFLVPAIFSIGLTGAPILLGIASCTLTSPFILKKVFREYYAAIRTDSQVADSLTN